MSAEHGTGEDQASNQPLRRQIITSAREMAAAFFLIAGGAVAGCAIGQESLPYLIPAEAAGIALVVDSVRRKAREISGTQPRTRRRKKK